MTMNLSICACLVLFVLTFQNQIAGIYALENSETFRVLIDTIPTAVALIGFNWAVARGACYALSIQHKQAPFLLLYAALFPFGAYYLGIVQGMNSKGLFIALSIMMALDSITYLVLLMLEDWEQCSEESQDRIENCREELEQTKIEYGRLGQLDMEHPCVL